MAEHFCKIHNKEFKQTEKMRKAGRGYSHAISNPDGTTSWCNEGDQETYHSPYPDADKVAKLAPQPSDKVLPEHQEEINKATTPAPQAVGMLTKEIGDMMRAGLLKTIFGATITTELVKWYRSQVFGITRITYDGKDLPAFK